MGEVAKKLKVGVCSIFKNEGPYILEWLAYHRVIGVDEFFIADNESNDHGKELLRALSDLGLIHLLPFPTPSDRAPQLPAYEALMEEHSASVDWVAFIDADEFLLPATGQIKSALEVIISQEASVGAIAVNWASYGSSEKKQFDPAPVIKRFQGRGEQNFGVNRHYKSMVKVSAYAGTEENPHLFKLKPDYIYVDTAGALLEHDVQGIKGLSKNVCWDNLRLNHYIIKSYGEFLYKKSRGRATVKNNSRLDRDINFFRAHDVNDILEPFSPVLLEKTCAELERLKSLLIVSGAPSSVVNVVPPRIPNIQVAIDRVGYSECLTIVGWAFADDGSELSFSLGVNGANYTFDSVDRIGREDVVQQVSGAPAKSGFSCKIKLDAIGSEAQRGELLLRMHANGYMHAVSIGNLSSSGQ